MCGIVGVCHFDDEPVGMPLLRRMTDLIAHRGPDGEGHYADGRVGLGHRRLAVIDLSASANQPMCNETGNVIVVYNGEIYNFQKLRVELEAGGHQFRSKSDSEVVVHAWEEWGTGCVLRFNGMFAFAVWDQRNGSIFLARDRYGIKPLYYYRKASRLVFGSEIRPLLSHPDVRANVSPEALSEYFTFQNVLSDTTLFEDIRILPAGSSLLVDTHTGHTLHEERYWDFAFSDEALHITREEATEEITRLFTQAVTRQLVSDVPIGSYLSGGMDSGSITAVARHHLGRLSTFTCGFDLSSASGLELGFDERRNAEGLANLLKTEHYEVVLHAGDMECVMPDLVWHLEDLRVGQCYPNYYIARLASKFVKVVLSGAGGDELFAGYPWRYYHGLNSNGHHDFYRNYYNFWQRLVPDDEKPQLFNEDTWRRARHHSPFDVFRNVMADGHPGRDLATNEAFVNASLYFELKTFLHGLLVVEDRMSMAHSLETRVPFLDNDLVDFVMQVPACYKLENLSRPGERVDENEPGKQRRHELQTGDGKIILRQAMSRIIPPQFTARAKQGFSAPDASWFRGESIEYINSLLGSRRARLYEYLMPEYVDRILKQHSAGVTNHRLLIWSFLCFEWWLRCFLV
jgi:asparagine synthase (glutamine-hydrolysing)